VLPVDWSTDDLQALAGQVQAVADDVVKLSQNAYGELAGIAGVPGAGEANFGREVSRFVSNYTPGSNLWYARLAATRCGRLLRCLS